MEAPMEEKKPEINFSTGCALLDLAVGGGIREGFKAGKIINICGGESSAKSFLAAEIIATAKYRYKEKFKWVYDDSESGFTFNTKSLYGFNVIPKDSIRSNTVQELYSNFRAFLEHIKKNEFGIYVIDSLDGLSSDQLLEISNERFNAFKKGKEYNKGSFKMEAAKFLSQEFFRGLACIMQDKNVTLLVISQVRYNIDPFSFKKFDRSGGKALDHYSDTVLWLANVAKIKKKGRVIEILVRAKTSKSKTPRPYRQCDFSVIFDYGVDDIGTSIDYIFNTRGDSGKVLKSAKIKWDDTITEISRIDLIDKIEDSKKMQKELKKRVVDKWEKIEKEVKTKRKAKYQ